MSASTELYKLALQCGAFAACRIPVDDVVTDTVFRDICRGNQCGMYGKCWVCPPDVGDIEELTARLRSYTGAVFYQTVAKLEDSFDFEGMAEGQKAHFAVSYRLQEAIAETMGGEDLLHLSCGGCGLCVRCAKLDALPCRFPEKALSSLEAYGIDVYTSVKNSSLKYNHGANTVTYFGAVFFRG